MAKRFQKKLQCVPVLPDDVLFEIFSRIPYRSLCHFKCVSRPWRALCSDPELRRKAAQTLSVFFFYTHVIDGNSNSIRLLNLTGRGQPMLDPPLPFLGHYGHRIILHSSCNGLLLCQCRVRPRSPYEFDYVVCNPATKQWIVLPPNAQASRGCTQAIRLGFDPAVSSHFEVFMFLLSSEIRPITAVLIFSSESGDWTYRESELADDSNAKVSHYSDEVFFNGTMHITATSSSIITVDSEGKTWRNIPTPCVTYNYCSSMGHSQGCLYITHVDNSKACQLLVWVLEDYDRGRWTLKHTVCILGLYGRSRRRPDEFFDVIAIHPECNLVFIIERTMQQNCLLAYNMDRQKVNFICALDGYSTFPAKPYIPYFGEWL